MSEVLQEGRKFMKISKKSEFSPLFLAQPALGMAEVDPRPCSEGHALRSRCVKRRFLPCSFYLLQTLPDANIMTMKWSNLKYQAPPL